MKYRIKILILALFTFALPAFAGQSWQLAGAIYRGAIPLAIPSSGSFGTNGALTLTTALPATYASIYLYFPAGAICSGSAAGLYYTAMSSTTAGTVYNNTYASGQPAIPSSPATYTCATAPGAYTQSTSKIALLTYTLEGGFLSANGALRFAETWDFAGTPNDKTLTTALAGTTLFSELETTNNHNTSTTDIITENRGVTNSQVSDSGVFGTTAGAVVFTSIDTTTNQNITISGTLANAADYIILEQSWITALP